MNYPLLKKDVEMLMKKLNSKQRDFLEGKVKRGKKSKWLEKLARYKGVVLSEGLSIEKIEEKIDDWILEDILDGGYGNKPYQCVCGKPLRFQYIVRHKNKKQIYKLGETCFENYTLLPPQLLKDIKEEMHKLDLERDEILIKYHKQDLFDLAPYLELGLDISSEIIEQYQLGLPLMEKQIKKVMSFYNVYKLKEEIIKRRSLLQKQEIGSQSKKKREDFELISNTSSICEIEYDVFLERHLETLKEVRSKEKLIPLGLKSDWLKIQQIVRNVKNDKPIDYGIFKVMLSNLIISLGINKKVF